MAVKNANAKAWNITPSYDGLRWSAWPAGDKPEPTLPTYAVGQAVNEWRELSGSSLSLAPTMAAPNGTGGAASKQEAWNGWIKLARKIYSRGQGGHGDYHGNEVDVIDVDMDAPAWAELLASSLAASVTSTTDYYSDGRPASQHGYMTGIGAPELGTSGKIIAMPGGARSTNGGGVPQITAFDVSANAYDNEATWSASLRSGSWEPGAQAYARHPTTGAVYCWRSNTDIWRWDPGVPGSWTSLGAAPGGVPAAFDTASAIDPTRNAWFLLGGGLGGDFCHRYNIDSNTVDAITLTGTDIKANDAMGLVYSSVTDRYYACTLAPSGGSTVYEITPTSGTSWACALLSTTGGSGLPVVDINARAPYTKFLYIPDIRGTTVGGIFYGPRWASNLWFLRLH